MKRKLLSPILVFLLLLGCSQEEEFPEPTEVGYLSMSVTLTITSEEANGRIEAVDTDDFKVTIFDAGGTEIMVFDPFSSAPSEVPLPTGEYYVEAHSNNLVDAAFENPYYFGSSANFTIDKEETTTIDIVPELANTKVAILYSENVENTFDTYTGTVEVLAGGASLFYGQGETREGYFIVSPLEISVNLSYTKLDGTTIDRVLTTTIDDPQPKTLYNINVDATLENGIIIFNIVVDENFDIIDIGLGDTSIQLPLPENGFYLDDIFYPTPTAYFGCQEDVSWSECQILFSNGQADLCSGNQITSIAGISSQGPITEIASGQYDFSTLNNGGANSPELPNTFIWSLAITDIPGYDTNCEPLPGFQLYDTDINGTSSGYMNVSKNGNEYTILYEYEFVGGPKVAGSYIGEIEDISNPTACDRYDGFTTINNENGNVMSDDAYDFERDGNDRINLVKRINGPGDTTFINLIYDTQERIISRSVGQYTHVFSYDASGHMFRSDQYNGDPANPVNREAYTEYLFAGTQIVELIHYSDAGILQYRVVFNYNDGSNNPSSITYFDDTNEIQQVINYQYDEQTNPNSIFGLAGIYIVEEEGVLPFTDNNITSIHNTYYDAGIPQEELTLNLVYQYNSLGYPLSFEMTSPSIPNFSFEKTFNYQCP